MQPEIADLPDDARVWIFGADRPLERSERELLHDELRRFLREWNAHGSELAAGFTIDRDRFVVVALDESHAAASGCSIDALLHALGSTEERLGVGLRDGGLVFHRDADGEIVACDRAEFRRRANRGEVTEATGVFDLTVDRLGTWRERGLERAAGESWHARLLRSSRTTEARRAG